MLQSLPRESLQSMFNKVSLATGIQPVSRGWIGLDAKMRRGDTPIRQVIIEYITKTTELQVPWLNIGHSQCNT